MTDTVPLNPKDVLYALVYFWLRDSEFALNDKTAHYVKQHLDALQGTLYLSDRELKEFIAANFDGDLDLLSASIRQGGAVWKNGGDDTE